jgi:hypothetical protein
MLVPAELVDHIFSFLRGERSALEECSKAHPMFSRLAEPYLYADILIHMSNERALSELYKQLSENPHILNFPRTLEILRGDPSPMLFPQPKVLSIMSVIPQMTNLVSLTLEGQWCDGLYDFLSTFRTCLRQSAIEELCLKDFLDFPFSILDNGKNIKKLTLIQCTADEPISTSGSPHQSLETLIIGFRHDPDILLWATHRATSLTTLELRGSLVLHCTRFAELLKACSNSLTRLHLDIGTQCMQHPSLFSLEFTYIS